VALSQLEDGSRRIVTWIYAYLTYLLSTHTHPLALLFWFIDHSDNIYSCILQ